MPAVIEAEVVGTGIAKSNGDMFLPAMRIDQAVSRYNAVLEFTKDIMKEGKDFGAVPGSDKPCLLKPGAEKLCSFFGLTPRLEIVEKVEDWTGNGHAGEPFFYFHYRAQLYRGDYLLGEAEGSCNSMESKYRYRWVAEDQIPADQQKAKLRTRGGRISEPTFAVERAETGGKYGKPMEYWQRFRDAIANRTAAAVKRKKKDGGEMDAWEIDATLYRVPNPDVADQVNTIQKMGQKRALVAVTLIVCNASEYYTQDLDDADYIDNHAAPTPTVPPAADPEQKPPPSNGHAGNGTNGSAGKAAEKQQPADRVNWFRERIPLSHLGCKNETGAFIRTPEQQLVYLRDGIGKQGFSDEICKELGALWFKAAFAMAASQDELTPLWEQAEKQGFSAEVLDDLGKAHDARWDTFEPTPTPGPAETPKKEEVVDDWF